jgi:hypothetical protein
MQRYDGPSAGEFALFLMHLDFSPFLTLSIFVRKRLTIVNEKGYLWDQKDGGS